MAVPARIQLSWAAIFIGILVFLAVKVGIILLQIGGPLWTIPGGGLMLVLFPIVPLIVFGFLVSVIVYGYSYFALWLLDQGYFILGILVLFISVIIIPGALGVISMIYFI